MRSVIYFFIGLILVLVFLTALANAEYKCLAELYPETITENGIQKLGDIYISEKGNKFRVLAECKKINEEVWLQFLDTDMLPPYELDNRTDYIMQLFMEDDQLWMGNVFKPDEFAGIGAYLQEYCDKHKIKIEDFIHVAPGVLDDIIPRKSTKI